MRVSTGSRSGGGVSRFEMSRMPSSDRCSRARDRRRRQRQHVHHRPQPFQLLLVFDAEALLLVDHDQPQILEAQHRPTRCGACR